MKWNVYHVFWITNWDNKKTIYASPAFEKTWGKKVEALYKNPELWAKSIHPEDRKHAYEKFLNLDKPEDIEAEFYSIEETEKEPEKGVTAENATEKLKKKPEEEKSDTEKPGGLL